MRDFIALLSHALKALVIRRAAGRHSATCFAESPVPSAPAEATRRLPDHVLERSQPLAGEEVSFVRPYLVAWEAERGRRLQRERRTAAALASFGIDYDIETAVA